MPDRRLIMVSSRSAQDGGRPWALTTVFADDIMVPAQLDRAAADSATYCPEKRLLLAVLVGAFADLTPPLRIPIVLSKGAKRLPKWAQEDWRAQRLRDQRGRHRDAMAERDEALAWFASDDVAWPFSFVSICGWLGFAPGPIRRRVLQDAAVVSRRYISGPRGTRTAVGAS